MTYEELMEKTNEAAEIALAQQDFLNAMNKGEHADIRPGTLADVLTTLRGNRNYKDHLVLQHIFNQLSYQTADDFAILNIWCPNRDILVSPGTKTLISVELNITERTTLYADLPIDNVNNYLAQVQNSNGNIFTIQQTETFEPGTYIRTFECDEFGAIYVGDGEVNQIVNPIKGWGLDGKGSAVNVGEPISIGTPPDSIADLQYKISKTTSIHNPQNLYQGLKKKLLNAGAKDAIIWISTNEHNYTNQGVPLNAWLIVCDGGDIDAIFDAISSECLGRNLVGEEHRVMKFGPNRQEFRFSYATQTNFYIKIVIQSQPLYIPDVENFKNLLQERIKAKQNEYSNLTTTLVPNSEIISYAQSFFQEQDLARLYTDSCQLKINSEDSWANSVEISSLDHYLYIQTINDIEIVINGND